MVNKYKGMLILIAVVMLMFLVFALFRFTNNISFNRKNTSPINSYKLDVKVIRYPLLNQSPDEIEHFTEISIEVVPSQGGIKVMKSLDNSGQVSFNNLPSGKYTVQIAPNSSKFVWYSGKKNIDLEQDLSISIDAFPTSATSN